jgi:hypothetical protein
MLDQKTEQNSGEGLSWANSNLNFGLIISTVTTLRGVRA